MLQQAVVVLTNHMTIADALRQLESYSDKARVALRRELGSSVFWYLFEAAEIRQRLADQLEDEILEDVLLLAERKPADTLQAVDDTDLGAFSGLVLDGDRLVGVAAPAPEEQHPAAKRAELQPFEAPDLPLDYTPRFRGRSAEDISFDVVPIFYATDRKAAGDLRSRPFYTSERGVELSFGIAEVSIPQNHRRGEVERPRVWRIELREEPARHVVVMSVRELERKVFLADLRSDLEKTNGREALVFVHGYRVSFEEAARRTAQIAHDLSFAGIPMLYSWPSQGTFTGYFTDETNARWTESHFEELLRLVLSEVGALQVHVLAHSMGNRPLIETLSRFDIGSLPAGSATLSQVIFAAPDIDAGTFRDLARAFHQRADRCTLYASSNDEALAGSRKLLRSGLARAGESGARLVVVDGVNTIDASEVETSLLGHSYYGEQTILADIFYLLRGGQEPDDRFGLVARDLAGFRYWEFQR